jgi:hypothetical protein
VLASAKKGGGLLSPSLTSRKIDTVAFIHLLRLIHSVMFTHGVLYTPYSQAGRSVSVAVCLSLSRARSVSARAVSLSLRSRDLRPIPSSRTTPTNQPTVGGGGGRGERGGNTVGHQRYTRRFGGMGSDEPRLPGVLSALHATPRMGCITESTVLLTKWIHNQSNLFMYK